MRQGVKSIFAKEMDERGMTPIIASHNLRELEDICDHVGLIHKGGVLLSKDLEEMKCNIQKVQCVFKEDVNVEEALAGMEILKLEKRGSLHTITARAGREEIIAKFACFDTLFFEALPLSLEEIFISETEVVGYDIKNLILG
nr:ABC transporter ATP-binding protein [Lachnospiraceae bacterium]